MSAASVKAWLRPRLRRGWLAMDRWLMPDPAPALAHLRRDESPQLPAVRRRLAKGVARRCDGRGKPMGIQEVHEG